MKSGAADIVPQRKIPDKTALLCGLLRIIPADSGEKARRHAVLQQFLQNTLADRIFRITAGKEGEYL